MALAEVVGDKVEAAYRRGDLFDKRGLLIAAWEQLCFPPATASEVGRFASAAEYGRNSIVEFDSELLHGALDEGRIEADERTITLLGNGLKAIEQRYCGKRSEKRQGPVVADIAAALTQIRCAAAIILRTIDDDARTGTCSLEITLSAFSSSTPNHIDAVRALQHTTEQALIAIELNDAHRSKRKPETWLFIDLWDLYSQLLAGQGKEAAIGGGEGPLYQFEKACVGIIDGKLSFPEPKTFRGCIYAATHKQVAGRL